jgi:spore maturation protein CgeB
MPDLKRPLRYLWAYSAADPWTLDWHDKLLARRVERGYEVRHFCVTPASLQHKWLPFPELDRRWRRGDRVLMTLYEQLATELDDRDVLVLYNGANLHPRFVEQLSALKVYTAGDDPESTEILTRPAAPAFDIHLVNNAACLEMYRSWGLSSVHFWPLGSQVFPEEVADLTQERVADGRLRDLSVALFCERNAAHRLKRLDALAAAFPDGRFAGRGWPSGFASLETMRDAYRRAQIGVNVHNSTGPVNFRTYELPAFGVMQLCDNRAFLPRVFEVGREVVAYDTMTEAIDLARYYLAHPDEQRAIALAGWQRWKRDYTPDAVWSLLVAIVEAYVTTNRSPAGGVSTSMLRDRLAQHVRRTAPLRLVHPFVGVARRAAGRALRAIGLRRA